MSVVSSAILVLKGGEVGSGIAREHHSSYHLGYVFRHVRVHVIKKNEATKMMCDQDCNCYPLHIPLGNRT